MRTGGKEDLSMSRQSRRISIHARSASWAAALVATLAVAGCGCPESTSEKFETIPLASIHTSSKQEGLQYETLGGETLAGEKLPNHDLAERFLRLPPRTSNVFLGVAKDLDEAIEVALRFDGRSEVVLPKPGDKSQIWLIVFLGLKASVPPQWNIDSVEYSQSKIRVSYS